MFVRPGPNHGEPQPWAEKGAWGPCPLSWGSACGGRRQLGGGERGFPAEGLSLGVPLPGGRAWRASSKSAAVLRTNPHSFLGFLQDPEAAPRAQLCAGLAAAPGSACTFQCLGERTRKGRGCGGEGREPERTRHTESETQRSGGPEEKGQGGDRGRGRGEQVRGQSRAAGASHTR